MSHPWLSDRAGSFDSSGIRRVFDLAAQMTDPINLSIGQPDFAVPEQLCEATIEAIRKGRNGYTMTGGADDLRQSIGELLSVGSIAIESREDDVVRDAVHCELRGLELPDVERRSGQRRVVDGGIASVVRTRQRGRHLETRGQGDGQSLLRARHFEPRRTTTKDERFVVAHRLRLAIRRAGLSKRVWIALPEACCHGPSDDRDLVVQGDRGGAAG